jgi:hypothetical protein
VEELPYDDLVFQLLARELDGMTDMKEANDDKPITWGQCTANLSVDEI